MFMSFKKTTDYNFITNRHSLLLLIINNINECRQTTNSKFVEEKITKQ